MCAPFFQVQLGNGFVMQKPYQEGPPKEAPGSHNVQRAKDI